MRKVDEVNLDGSHNNAPDRSKNKKTRTAKPFTAAAA
jgi:hypothetical protein